MGFLKYATCKCKSASSPEQIDKNTDSLATLLLTKEMQMHEGQADANGNIMLRMRQANPRLDTKFFLSSLQTRILRLL